MKTMDAGKWLEKNTDKDAQPKYWTPHLIDEKTVSCNRYMAFVVHESVNITEDGECGYAEGLWNILREMDNTESGGEITRYHLEAAARVGLAIMTNDHRRNEPTLKMYLNGSAVCKAQDAENGEVSTEIVDGEAWAEKTLAGKPTRKQKNNPLVKTVPTFLGGYQLFQIARYTHTGEDVELWINPKFLLTALVGLPDLITYKVTDSMLYLCGEVDGILREVVIMGMEKK